MEHALSLHDTNYPAYGLEGGLVSTIDAAFVGLTMSYVADSMGLSNVMIGAIRNNPVEVAELFGPSSAMLRGFWLMRWLGRNPASCKTATRSSGGFSQRNLQLHGP
jgi:hypothetical protein